jgi:hypothetical protein
MEKFKAFEAKIQTLRQERLKLERRIKIREAHDMQNNVLHCRTLEKEIKVIEKQKNTAITRNDKILNEALQKVGEFNENLTRNSLKKSNDRLKTAKIQFFEVILAEHPEWVEAIKDPVEYEKKKYQESLEKLRIKQAIEQEQYKKLMENQLEVIRAKEKYMNEIFNDRELALVREKNKQEFLFKAEQEKSSIKAFMDSKREQDINREIEIYNETSKELLNQGIDRLSTPNTHIPNEIQIKRINNEDSYSIYRKTQNNFEDDPRSAYINIQDPKNTYKNLEDPKNTYKNVEDPKNIYKSVDDPRNPYKSVEDPKNSYKSVEDPRNPYKNVEDPRNSYKSVEDPRSPYKSVEDPKNIYKSVEDPITDFKNIEDSRQVYKNPEKTKNIEKPRKSYKDIENLNLGMQKAVELKKKEEYNKTENLITDQHIHSDIGSQSLESSSKKKASPTHFPKSVEKIIEASDDDDEAFITGEYNPKNPQNFIEKKQKPQIQAIKNIPKTTMHIAVGSKDSAGSEFNIDEYIELPDNSIPIAIIPKDTKPAVEPQYKVKKLSQDTTKSPQNIEVPIIKQSPQKNPPDTQAVIIKQESPKLNNPIQEEKKDSSAKHDKNSSMSSDELSKKQLTKPVLVEKKKPDLKSVEVPAGSYSADPKVLRVEETSGNSFKPRTVEIETDKEFEITTVKSKPQMLSLKPKEIDIEASIEDSGDIDNPYLAGVVERTKQPGSQISSKKNSELDSAKPIGKPENIFIDSRGSSRTSELNSSKGRSKLDDKSLIKYEESKASPRLEPMSPGSMTSSNFALDQPPQLLTSNLQLNTIEEKQRKRIVDDLIILIRQNLVQSTVKITKLPEIVPTKRLEKLYENYKIDRNKFQYKNNEELLWFILSLGSTIPLPFLPAELSKSKKPFTEAMIKEKLSQNYSYIFSSIKELLSDSIKQNWISEDVACEMFTDTLINFKTSKSQYKRCQQHLTNILKADLSRPPTSIKDSSFDNSRLVTPDRSYIPIIRTGQVLGSGIENFKEIDEDYD